MCICVVVFASRVCARVLSVRFSLTLITYFAFHSAGVCAGERRRLLRITCQFSMHGKLFFIFFFSLYSLPGDPFLSPFLSGRGKRAHGEEGSGGEGRKYRFPRVDAFLRKAVEKERREKRAHGRANPTGRGVRPTRYPAVVGAYLAEASLQKPLILIDRTQAEPRGERFHSCWQRRVAHAA